MLRDVSVQVCPTKLVEVHKYYRRLEPSTLKPSSSIVCLDYDWRLWRKIVHKYRRVWNDKKIIMQQNRIWTILCLDRDQLQMVCNSSSVIFWNGFNDKMYSSAVFNSDSIVISKAVEC